MKTIVYTCPFVPAEWIAAHGLRPSRILPGATTAPGAAAGTCPYAHAFLDEVSAPPSADAVVVTTVCDQMRRGAERIARYASVFLMNVPATWQTAAPQRLYADEVRRLGLFLTRLGGTPPSMDALAETMRRYDAARSRLRAARGCLSPRRYSEAIAEFHRAGGADFVPPPEAASPGAAPRGSGRRKARGVPLAIVGGPLRGSDFGVFDQIEECGGQVVLDATESGELSLPAPMDRRRVGEDPLAELASMYFGQIPHPFRRPNSQLYQWLGRELAQRGARGILFRRYVWCDLWHAELQRMKEWTALGVADLDVTDTANTVIRTSERIGSLIEMLTAGAGEKQRMTNKEP